MSQIHQYRKWIQGWGCVSTVVLLSTMVQATPGLAIPAQPNDAIADSSVILAQAQDDIVDTALAQGSLDTLIGLLEELGMAEDLRGYGRFTVFAPTDSAFQAIPDDVFQKLASDRELMARVLAYHVISAAEPLTSEDVTATATYRTLERSDIELRSRGRRLYVNDVRVVEPDIGASNGVIHIIDQVLIPADVLAELQ